MRLPKFLCRILHAEHRKIIAGRQESATFVAKNLQRQHGASSTTEAQDHNMACDVKVVATNWTCKVCGHEFEDRAGVSF